MLTFSSLMPRVRARASASARRAGRPSRACESDTALHATPHVGALLAGAGAAVGP